MSEYARRCDDCGTEYTIAFRLPDILWQRISGGFHRLCPECANIAAGLAGIVLAWSVIAQEEPVNV